ncbi:MAG TPA: YigZ family protein, partial [Ruminococcaceae bacterium]|nr:YigZ family protein [Oscillospiraceae bacterium]
QKCSDDGEPQGTGGVPVLNAVIKSGAVNAAVVVTRYFGGVLLGAGGLIRAYSRAASDA